MAVAARHQQEGVRFALGRAAACAAVAAACAACAAGAGGAIGWLPALTFAVTVAACGVCAARYGRRIRVDVPNARVQCVRGDASGFAVDVRNDGWLPCPRAEVELFVEGPPGAAPSAVMQRVPLPPRSSVPLALQAAPDHIGVFRAGVRRVRVYDPIGLFRRTVPVAGSCEVEVLPRSWTLADAALDAEAAAETARTVIAVPNEGMDYAGVRAYVQGDPIKTIHWKLSARVGEYLTRLYESYTTPGLTVVADFDAPDYPPEVRALVRDGVIEAAFALLAHARARSFEAELMFAEAGGGERRFAGAACDEPAGIVRAMPALGRGGGAGAAALFGRCARNRYGMGNVALVTANVGPAVVQAAFAAKREGKNPLVVAVVPKAADAAARTRFLAPLQALSDVRIAHLAIAVPDDLDTGRLS